jgi:hypothetical protein
MDNRDVRVLDECNGHRASSMSTCCTQLRTNDQVCGDRHLSQLLHRPCQDRPRLIMSEVFSIASSIEEDVDDLFGSSGNAAASSSGAGRTPSRKRNAESAQLSESRYLVSHYPFSLKLIMPRNLDSPAHPLRRSLIKAQIGNTSLEAKIFALEQRLKRRDEELDANRQETDKLMQDRRNLNRGYESAIAARDQARQELEAEKVCPASSLMWRGRVCLMGRLGIDTSKQEFGATKHSEETT